jgi:hypothetical protein
MHTYTQEEESKYREGEGASQNLDDEVLLQQPQVPNARKKAFHWFLTSPSLSLSLSLSYSLSCLLVSLSQSMDPSATLESPEKGMMPPLAVEDEGASGDKEAAPDLSFE